MGRRVSEMSTSNIAIKVGRFREYAVFAMRVFGSFAATSGAGFYGSELESDVRRHPITRREILARKGIRVPITNRIAKARPPLDLGLEYGASPDNNILMLNDFAPWPAAKLDDFRLAGGTLVARGNPSAIIYFADASIDKNNRIFGAAYGDGNIPGRERARVLLTEPYRRCDVL